MSEPSVEQIQEQVEHRRASLDHTLDAIERRLSFQEIASSPLQYVQDSVLGEYGGNLREAVSRNPIPVALLGVSLMWMMMGGQPASARAGETLRQKAGAAGDRLKEGAAAVRDKAEAGAESIKDRAQDTAERLQGKAGDTADRMRAKGESMTEGTQDTFQQVRRITEGYGRALQEHPLALSFVGLAVGAAMAALLPETRAEHRAMGETRDRLAEQASATGERVMEGAKSAMQAGAEAATQEAQRQAGRGSS